jgi:uncharacterized RDD family membrane protein YckC
MENSDLPQTQGSNSTIKKYHQMNDSHLPPAGFGSRVVAVLIDGIVVSVIQQLVLFVAKMPLQSMVAKNSLFNNIYSLAFIVIITYFYAVWPVMKWGYTPGKKLMGLKIVRYGDGDLGYAQIILREYIIKSVSFFLFFISIPLYFFNQEKRFIHDLICKTRVVKTN